MSKPSEIPAQTVLLYCGFIINLRHDDKDVIGMHKDGRRLNRFSYSTCLKTGQPFGMHLVKLVSKDKQLPVLIRYMTRHIQFHHEHKSDWFYYTEP